MFPNQPDWNRKAGWSPSGAELCKMLWQPSTQVSEHLKPFSPEGVSATGGKNLPKSPFFPGNHLHSNCSWANKAYRPYVSYHDSLQGAEWGVEYRRGFVDCRGGAGSAVWLKSLNTVTSVAQRQPHLTRSEPFLCDYRSLRTLLEKFLSLKWLSHVWMIKEADFYSRCRFRFCKSFKGPDVSAKQSIMNLKGKISPSNN